MKRILLSLTSLVILASCAAKTNSAMETKTYNTYKLFESETAHNLKVKYDQIQANLDKIEQEKAYKRTVSSPVKIEGEERVSLGTFVVTAYTNGYESTQKHKGEKGYGITRSGAKTVEGITVSADPRVLPLGSVIEIEGYGQRIVQDTGGAIKNKKLDLFFEDLEDAKNFGRQKLTVKLISKSEKSDNN
jgi:3D (Asp-Asp-Asp) domain-containing protein